MDYFRSTELGCEEEEKNKQNNNNDEIGAVTMCKKCSLITK